MLCDLVGYYVLCNARSQTRPHYAAFHEGKAMKGNHFYMLILPSYVQDRRLAMPSKFIKIFGKELSNVAMLKFPSRKKWAVELRKYEDRVWLRPGRHGFMEYYSIYAGQVLVFRYKGNSQFDVVIFGETTSEIEYLYDDTHDRVLESMPEGSVTKKQGRITEAAAFSSGNPFCTVTMRPSYVSKKFTLNLPAVLSKTHLKENIRDVTLQVSDGRTWQVNCSRKNNAVTLCKGWKEFVLDNGLKVEDICIFELVDKKQARMKVTIFKLKGNTSLAQLPSQTGSPCFTVRNYANHRETNAIKHETCEEYGTVLKRVAEEGPVHFTGKSSRQQYISAPPGFAPIRCSTEDLQLMKKNGSPPRPSSFPPRGLFPDNSNATEGNALKVDSHCTMQKTRSSEFSVLPLKRQADLAPLPCKRVTFRGHNERIVSAGAFTSQNPFCRVIMRPSYVNGRFILGFPNSFAKKHLKPDIKTATLQVADGGTWQVRCSFGKNVKITMGWRKFALDNHLDEDDICIFELTDSKHIGLKVTIFRGVEEARQWKCSGDSSKRSTCAPQILTAQKGYQHMGKKQKLSDSSAHFDSSTEAPTTERCAHSHAGRENCLLTCIIDSENEFERRRGFIQERKVDEVKRNRCEIVGKYTDSNDIDTESTSEDSSFSMKRRKKSSVLIEQQTDKPTMKRMAFTSDKPFCMVTIRPAYLGTFLNFPTAFAKKYLEDAFNGIILRVPTGETWHAQCSASEPRKLTKGWKAFALANHLKKDDICIFELSDSSRIELTVTIIRAHRIGHDT